MIHTVCLPDSLPAPLKSVALGREAILTLPADSIYRQPVSVCYTSPCLSAASTHTNTHTPNIATPDTQQHVPRLLVKHPMVPSHSIPLARHFTTSSSFLCRRVLINTSPCAAVHTSECERENTHLPPPSEIWLCLPAPYILTLHFRRKPWRRLMEDARPEEWGLELVARAAPRRKDVPGLGESTQMSYRC